MQLVSNYPQVPLATSNPATDAARIEGQQRPPVIPPQQPAKGHEERAFNPQHERTADNAQQYAQLASQVHERQQQSNQQQQQNSRQQAQTAAAQTPSAIIMMKPALKRKDIHLADNVIPAPPSSAAATAMPSGQSEDFYRTVARHVGNYYHQQTSPAADACIEALA
ncbi:hypothetical protein [Shewanella sp. YIC-542]|uniref:hypothetical protein n=1 Tax=Shewanella mytili TaxID=3377111 RepID=UPI00398F7B47